MLPRFEAGKPVIGWSSIFVIERPGMPETSEKSQRGSEHSQSVSRIAETLVSLLVFCNTDSLSDEQLPNRSRLCSEEV